MTILKDSPSLRFPSGGRRSWRKMNLCVADKALGVSLGIRCHGDISQRTVSKGRVSSSSSPFMAPIMKSRGQASAGAARDQTCFMSLMRRLNQFPRANGGGSDPRPLFP